MLKTAMSIFGGLLVASTFVTTARGGAFDDAEEWGGYWRRYESLGRHYDAPRVLYYGHAPTPEHDPVAPSSGDAPLYRRIPPTSTGQYVVPYHPQNYGRGRYYGPWLDPYYAPGRVSYGGVRYGWW